MGAVLDMSGASYVDVACLDITDFSSCGRSSQTNGCSTGQPLDDFAGSGVVWSNTSTYDTLTNVRIHGTAGAGMFGPTGTGVVMSGIDIVGNASSGWNADRAGTTGTGTLLVQNYNISWNGCAEEYPISHTLPYQDCTDDNVGGYGDGFGTATTASNPAWTVTFDQGVVSYNTQDGLDALHLIGQGSSMTITRTRAFGNMGQQIKVGGAAGTAKNNIITTNCNAMRQSIPGTPTNYNSRLTDFCRAADTGVYLATGKNAAVTFENNTVYSASATGIQIGCDDSNGACDSTSTALFRNNIFVGFKNGVANGYPSGGTDDYSNPIYVTSPVDPFQNAGSSWTNNLTFHPKSTWTCPQTGEQSALCIDPQLTDETWHVYDDANVTPLVSSPVKAAGIALAEVTVDYNGSTRPNPPSVGAIEAPSAPQATFVASSPIANVAMQNTVNLTYSCTHTGDSLLAFGYSSTGSVTTPTLTGFTLGPVSGNAVGTEGGKTIYGFYGATCSDTNSHVYTFNYSTMFANYNAVQIVEFTPGTYAGGGVSPNPNGYSYLEASATTTTSNGAAIVFGATQGYPDGPVPAGYTVDSHTPNYTYTYWFTAYNNAAYTAPGTVSFQMPLYNNESFPAVIMLLH